jgi:hypothetical protein
MREGSAHFLCRRTEAFRPAARVLAFPAQFLISSATQSSRYGFGTGYHFLPDCLHRQLGLRSAAKEHCQVSPVPLVLVPAAQAPVHFSLLTFQCKSQDYVSVLILGRR